MIMDATAIAAAVLRGETTALAVAQDVLTRIAIYDAVQPQAWITRSDEDAVIAAARQVDERLARGEHLPLAGVPFAIKDNIDLGGVPTTAACPDFAYVPERSAHVVERMIAAGAVPVGKTNLDQFATGLNGTRSPYGAPACVFNRSYVSGGSSSGSAVVVAAGLVPIALGTDTAGSGRVPAAFNGLIGMKPTKGRWSTRGLVPACRSLDCITVFAQTIADAQLVDQVVAGFDPADSLSRPLEDRSVGMARIGVPRRDQLAWCGDAASERLYDTALAQLAATGAAIVDVDMAPLKEAALLLYNGPWVAERTAALEGFLADHADAFDPTVRAIVEGGRSTSGTDVFKGMYRLAELQRHAEAMWRDIDMLALPTAPTIYRIAEMRAAPVVLNSNLGIYTNFVNLLDMAALALPAGYRDNRTGFGITLIAPAWTDRALLDAGRAYLEQADIPEQPPLDLEGVVETVKLAVVGAHLEGMPLHWQLTSRGARLTQATQTAPTYRLYAMADSMPPKPALVHAADGAAIAVEVYELDVAAFGSFVAEVPAPLAIGTVTLADGSQVKGFVAEPRAMDGAKDITHLGGWRAFVASTVSIA
ncbi:putative allophanate hydrolase [Caenibius tardaugens NBRC 16725]|uniref:Putative allophanate hydrolase n=2 Tax=Caenibius TaxID=2827482 RepID=U2ZY96_9SPHN|nr:allophanate hydrolase [Caenibius tardaugens NBRC 16725]GAD50329.1 putative allophanate hydrolase [Caenibius tardaugens NBRC 16725]